MPDENLESTRKNFVCQNGISDVMVKCVGFGEVVDAFQEAQNTIGREINPTVYAVDEFRSKMAGDQHFLNAVLKGPMIFLIGDKGELERLAQ